jgi:uncharacterized membrane protein SirB2
MDIGTVYLGTKWVHVTCVILSISLFSARGAWIIVTRRGLWRWLRIVPHCIDTVLLASGLTLAFLIHQYPFYNSDWLTAKVAGLIAYIVWGVLLFRGSSKRQWQVPVGVFAVLTFVYIVSVALTKQPRGWLGFV